MKHRDWKAWMVGAGLQIRGSPLHIDLIPCIRMVSWEEKRTRHTALQCPLIAIDWLVGWRLGSADALKQIAKQEAGSTRQEASGTASLSAAGSLEAEQCQSKNRAQANSTAVLAKLTHSINWQQAMLL